MLALPVGAAHLIDHGMAAGDAGTVNRYFLGFLAAAVIFGIFAALRFYLVTWLGERVVADVRTAVYGRVVRMDLTFFEVTRTGEVLSRLTTDTTLVQSISGVNLPSRCARLELDRRAGADGAHQPKAHGHHGGADSARDAAAVHGRPAGARLSRASQDRIADSSGLAGETLNAMQTVQAFTLEELQSQRYGEAVEASFATAIRRTKRARGADRARHHAGVRRPSPSCSGWARAVLAGKMTGGQLCQFLLYAGYRRQLAPRR